MEMLRRFSHADYEEMLSWYNQRNQVGIPQDGLPEIGYIVPGVAAGFLVQTDTKMAFLDGFVGSPLCRSYQRHDAISRIIDRLIKDAKELGYTTILGVTSYESLVEDIKKFGFQQSMHDIYYKEV